MKTRFPIRLAAAVAAATLVAGACSSSGASPFLDLPAPTTAAPSVRLVAATIDEIGVTSVVPQGWGAAPGTAVFRGEDAHVAFGAVPSWTAPDPVEFGLTPGGREQVGGRWWDLYRGEILGTAVLLAVTPVGDADYFAEFAMPPDRADHYFDAVATPALEAFTVEPPAGIGGGLTLGNADVAGRTFAYAVGGAGDSTVVFEAGLGGSMSDWALVAPGVTDSARVLVYDRSGYGRSDATTAPRDAATMVAELRGLLSATGHEPPYVLVGHSLGGTVMDLFARTYPDEVSGLVLVDSRHHSYSARCLAELADTDGCVIPEDALDGYPPHMRAEWAALATTEQQLAAAPALDRDLDLVVITAGHPDGDASPADWQLWQETQRDYAALVNGARHIVAEKSDHQIPSNQPELIVGAIVDLVQS